MSRDVVEMREVAAECGFVHVSELVADELERLREQRVAEDEVDEAQAS